MRVVCERLVHRYVGREHGGHRGIAWSLELPRDLEQTVQRRSDLAGEDLGRPVPAYVAGYPLADGRFAFARTLYLTDADCLGAVRTETLLLDAPAQAALPDPLDLAAAFDEAPELKGELRRFREARAPGALAPLAVELPAPPAPARLLAALRALDPGLLRALLEGACGALPLCLVGEPPAGPPALDLLRALLQLYPRGAQWQVGFCAQALSPRPWAALQLVPPAAADRFVLRAAREADIAVVDLVRGEGRNLEPGHTADLLADLIARQAWGELDDLARRAGQVAAYRAPGDLGALLRYEALARAPRRAPEEQVELANHLRARGAPERAVAEPFRQLLLDPPEGRLVWLVNVVQTGWLTYRRAHPDDPDDAPEAVQGLLLRTLAAQRFDLTLGFLERCWPLYAEARAATEEAALALALGDDLLEPAAAPALVELLLVAAERQPGRAIQALARRGVAGPAALERAERALERHAGPAEQRRPAGLALLDAAAAAQAWDLVEREAARAASAPWSSAEHLAQVGQRAAALAPSPRRDALLSALFAGAAPALARGLEALLRALRADPAGLALAAVALRGRRELGPRPLARLAVVARRGGLLAEAAAARDLLARTRAHDTGPGELVRRARRALVAGAVDRAQAALTLARSHEDGHAQERTGALAPGALDEEAGAGGHEPLQRLDPAALETGVGAVDLNPDPAGGDDTGVNLLVPDDLVEPYREVLRAIARHAPANAGALLRLVPDAPFELPWDDLVALAAAPGCDDPRLLARLDEAAARPVAAALAGAALPAAPSPHVARALARGLALAQGDPGRWLELSADLAGALAPDGPEAEALATAALARLTSIGAPGDDLAARLLALARALPRRGHDLARAALEPLLRLDADAALALLEPARAAADEALLGAVGRGVREGALTLEQACRLGPAVLDGVLASLGEAFSLRLQNGLRDLLFSLAGAASPQRDALVAVALERLRPHVAPDLAFRAEVAQGLRARLGAAARDGALARSIATFDA